MKKILFISVLLLLLSWCGNNETKVDNEFVENTWMSKVLFSGNEAENSWDNNIDNIEKVDKKTISLTGVIEINSYDEFKEFALKFDTILPVMKIKFIDNDNRFENEYWSLFKMFDKLEINDYVFYKYLPQEDWDNLLPPLWFLIKFDKKTKKNFIIDIISINSKNYLFNSTYLIVKTPEIEWFRDYYIFYNINNEEIIESSFVSRDTCEEWFLIWNDIYLLNFYVRVLKNDCNMEVSQEMIEKSKTRVWKLYDTENDEYLWNFDVKTKFEITRDDMINSIEKWWLWFHADKVWYKYLDWKLVKVN
jgi:hypothetical protein